MLFRSIDVKEAMEFDPSLVLNLLERKYAWDDIDFGSIGGSLKGFKIPQAIINVFEDVKDILDIFNYSIEQIMVKDINLDDEKYKYLFTVDSINNLVVDGMSFRDAYQKIGAQVQEGTYKPNISKKHTHIGSIHNLCLDNIRDKFPE